MNPAWLASVSFWSWFGFAGQLLLMSRWVLQWVLSERKGSLVIPILFWWMSFTGSAAMTFYAVAKWDFVLFVGQPLCVFIYGRNLVLVVREARRPEPAPAEAA